MVGAAAHRRPEAGEGGCMAVLCVRSGLHLLCSCLNLPSGSEVLVSGLNIPDVPAILEHHNLVCVPIDLELETLSVDMRRMAAALTPRTRVVLIAHVYGARGDMTPVIEFAAKHSLFVIEDCAEALDGMRYKGHARSDAALFSFGPIKFGSVFQGGIVRVADAALLRRLRDAHACWPVQGRAAFFWRCLKYLLLVLLQFPVPIWLIMTTLKFLRLDHQTFFVMLVRSYSRGLSLQALLTQLRQQPSTPLLHSLARRLRSSYQNPHPDNSKVGRRMIQLIRNGLDHERVRGEVSLSSARKVLFPGEGAPAHTFWVFPMLVNRVPAPAPLALLLPFLHCQRSLTHARALCIPALLGRSAATDAFPPPSFPPLLDIPPFLASGKPRLLARSRPET